MPETLCAQIVGHENLAMIHQVYLHLTDTDASEALMAALSKADNRRRA
jgi:integrase